MLRQNQMNIEDFHQKHFRPSCLPALNLRFQSSETFHPYYEKTPEQIELPSEWTRTPEDTLINYFSILREAENVLGKRSCGTIGYARLPFPIAYKFLSEDYQKKVSYEDYFQSFAGIGHTSLIKLCQIPHIKQGTRFFYELETIEVFEDLRAEYFGYSYGFIDLIQKASGYQISNIERFKEDFLCAPYHGWGHDAESAVEVKYGGWCKLIQKRYPTITKDYIKYINFHGTDGADYHFIFFTLTNGTDVEIAQFRKLGNENWKQIQIIPEDECIKEGRG